MQKSANILLPVAKVLKSFGTKGEFIIRYSPQTLEDINEKKPVFLYYDGLPVPFFIESIQDRGIDQAVIKLEGIYNEQLASEIAGELIYIEKKQTKRKSTVSEPSDLIGFSIIDTNGKLLGRISDFYDFPNNPCLGIIKPDSDNVKTNKENEQLIPFHEEFIIDLDIKKATLTVQLPEGLLSL